MAFPATHLRFALDVQNNYKIEKLNEYLSGTNYPDSRYVTKIDRTMTHDVSVLLPEFATTDFKKGWQVHKFCDSVQYDLRSIIFPDISFVRGDYEENDWVVSTALKIIQDMDDMQKFDLQSYLPALNYSLNPNGEELEVLVGFNRLIKQNYLNKKVCAVEDYSDIMSSWGIDRSLIDRVITKIEEFSADEGKLAKIKSIYDLMLVEFERRTK